MRLVSWNVNGLRACINKGFLDFFNEMDADIFAIQEIKLQEGQIDLAIPGYNYYINSALKKGYSGTLIYTKNKPINVNYGLIDGKYNDEGRVITLEFENFYFITIYSPNSQNLLKRLDYRLEFEKDLKAYLKTLNKEVIICGDLNVAHEEIDIKNPKSNVKNAGFTSEERTAFSRLLEDGYIDTFRYLHQDLVKYSWWSYKLQAREKGIGWRIDYFLVSDKLKDLIEVADIKDEILGSDHAPIILELKEV